ncbi:MAG: GumC family protein [Bryobacteraceae bacterium]
MKSISSKGVTPKELVLSARDTTWGIVPRSGGAGWADASADPDATTLASHVSALSRQKWWIILPMFIGIAMALLITWVQPNLYRVRASVLIEDVNENFLSIKDLSGAAPVSGHYDSAESHIKTQIEILRSKALVDRALDKMGDKSHLLASRSTVSNLRALAGFAEEPLATDPLTIRKAALNHLQVTPTAQTRIVEISFKAPDAAVAAEFANTLAREYIDYTVEERWKSSRKTSQSLRRELAELKETLDTSGAVLQNYARSTGLLYTGDKTSVAEEKLRQLQAELSKAAADRVAKQARYEAARRGHLESLPEVLESPAFRDQQSKLADLRRHLAELSSLLTPANYKVKQVQDQITELERILEKERRTIANRLGNEYESAVRREELLEKAYEKQAIVVSGQAGKAVQYSLLKGELDINRQLYDTMSQRVKEAGISSSIRPSTIRILDAAEIPETPAEPQPVVNGSVGMLAGLMFGVFFALIRERLDRTLKGPGEVTTHLNLPELGVIPAIGADPATRSMVFGKLRKLSLLGSDKEAEAKPELVSWNYRYSLLAESFRATLASLLYTTQIGSLPRAVLITSPAPREGKTTAVANLGIAMASINSRVLLVDGDIRRPRLHDIFNVPNDYGLTDILLESTPVQEIPKELQAQKTAIPGLFVLTSGSAATATPDILHSARMAELLLHWRREFDQVLIDSPPVLQLADARVLGRLVDGVILLFRAGQTSKDTAQAALRRFNEDCTPVLGTILNDWDPRSSGQSQYLEDFSQYYPMCGNSTSTTTTAYRGR